MKMQGSLFKKLGKNSVKNTKVQSFLLPSASSLSLDVYSTFHLLYIILSKEKLKVKILV